MREITGIIDIDNIIYDYIYGERDRYKHKDKYNKVIKEYNKELMNFAQGVGTMKFSHKYFKSKKLNKHMNDIMYNIIWTKSGYRDPDRSDVIHL